ncbi:polyprenyl synthetase family protein, partial [bacterium]|nr:polyprenyl synthetase family protein [bacterium]
APMAAGALLSGAGEACAAQVARAGLQLGMAFQANDDLLDVEGDTEKLGKTAGKDAKSGKATWIRLAGVRAARRRTAAYGRRGLRLLADCLPDNAHAARLLDLGRLLWDRES